MRSFTFAELSLGKLSAAEFEPFFCCLRVNEADPLIPASPVPISRPRALTRSAAVTPLPASYPTGLDLRRIWRNPADSAVNRLSLPHHRYLRRSAVTPAEFDALFEQQPFSLCGAIGEALAWVFAMAFLGCAVVGFITVAHWLAAHV